MMGRMLLTSAALYEDSSAHDELTSFLAQALANEHALRLSLNDDGGVLSSESYEERAPVLVSGRWRATNVTPTSTDGTGVGLLVPLLFYIREIRLEASELVTLGLDNTPAADIFARSLMCSYLRGSRIEWEASKWFRSSPSRAFAARYVTVLADNLNEPAFAGTSPAECLDVALANLYLGKPVFENPLLRLGAQHLYAGISRNALQRSFGAARAEVLKVVAP